MLLLYRYFRGICAFAIRQGVAEKNVLKNWSQNKKFEKPCHRGYKEPKEEVRTLKFFKFFALIILTIFFLDVYRNF